MRNFSKKFLAILLTLCMLAGVMPFGVFAAANTAEVAGQQLMLGDDLTMHFYVKTEAANATAAIQVGGVQRAAFSLAELTAGENGYDLSVDLAAAEMTEDIQLTVNDGTGDILTKTYSVQDYAHYLLENNYTDETKALVQEMLNYGAKAQVYFGHKTDDLANAGYEMETDAVIPAEAPVLEVSDSLSGMSFYGASMVYKSKIAVRFYFNAENGVDGYTFQVGEKSYTPAAKGSQYYIEVADINPDQMDTALNVSVTKDDESLSFSYSPMAYIIRMYNKESSSQALKDMLKAANGYFQAAKVFTGVAENRTGSLNFAYRYGTNNLIQVNTNLPSDTPCVNFTAGDNGCSIDQSANQYQQFGWVGMDNVDGVIVLTFHFNGAFEAGQTYVLPKGAVFGFTDNSKYTLDKNYTFTFDGSSWSMVAAEPAINLTYRYGTDGLIQFNTDLPSDTPCVNFTAGDNGCNINQSANQYQQVGWIGMDNVDGTIVLTFHFNSAYTAGQNYVISEGSLFGFSNGKLYQLNETVDLYWNGSEWSKDAPTIGFQYRYGTNNLIQVNANLPSDTPCVSFVAGDNGCNIDQSGNTVQWFGWAGMDNVDGTIVITFHFNNAFTAGQTYTLPKGAVFGFTDGKLYRLDDDYTFTFDGSSWTMEGGAAVEPEPTDPPATEPQVNYVSFQYRYGAANLIQFNTDLPATTALKDFLASDNGCNIIQSGDQQFGWVTMANADGTIVLTFNFNAAFTYGQSYTLSAGSVFGFTDGTSYVLDKDYTFYWDGASWSENAPAKKMSMEYRYGAANLIQFNTDLPATTALKDFLASDNGCQIAQGGDQQVGYVSMLNDNDTIVLTFNFNAAFTAGQSYTLSADSVFGFTDGTSYVLDKDYTFYWDGSAWGTDPVMTLSYRYGANNLIQFNTNLPSTTPCVNFGAGDNGCNIDQSANTVQWVGWIGMANADGTIVLTFNFNNAFTYGQSYCLPKGAVFGFTDGSSYKLDRAYTFYWDGQAWSETEPAPEVDVLEESNFTGGKEFTTFADIPADFTNSEKIEEYKGLGFNTSVITEDHIGGYGVGADDYYNVSVVTPEVPNILNLQCHWGTNNLIQIKTNLPTDVPTVNFTTSDNGCNVLQSGAQNVGWIQMNGLAGDVQLLTFHFNSAFEAGQSYTLSKGSVFGFTDGSSYVLGGDYTFTWDGSNWSMTAPEGAPATVTPMMDKLDMQYRYGTNNLIQVNTNLPASTPIVNFLASDNGCSLTQSGAQQFGWAGMDNVDGTIVITFHFNSAFEAGQSYTLSKGSVFGFTDGSKYELDSDYTFTWDGTNWSMSTSTLSFSVNYANGNTIQLKTNIPTGLTYGDFLLGDTSKGNLILETTEGAQAVGWFQYGELDGAVYLTFHLNGYNKPGTQYILKAGTSLKAGDRTFTTDRDYILTVNNAYLSGIENLDNAGLDVWVRNFTNKTGYFDDAMTKAILLYKEVIDGFYMVDEAFQNSNLLNAAGQQNVTTDFDALSADVVGWFNTNFAGKYFHSNHVPISSYDHYGDALTAANADAYRRFLEIYKDKFNKMVDASGSSIGFDNYPFVREQWTGVYSGISEQYLLNALIAAQVAGEYDFSLCVQTFEASGKKIFNIDSKRDITSAAEVSLQLYTGMAMGADVFEYFAYNSNGDFNAIMNQDGSKRIYDIVKEGNEALCFADVVNTFTWNGIVTSAGSVNKENDEAFSSVANMVLTNVSNGVLDSYASTDDAVIGCFTKGDLNGYMVVNFNDPKAVTGNNTVNLSFADCTRARVYTEVNGVLTSEVVELTNGSCTVTLAPGSGCFVIPA